MTFEEFEHFQQGLFVEMQGIGKTKGREYAGGEARFANFQRLAETLGLTPEKVLMVYLQKHLDAINSYVKTGAVLSEPIRGRIIDAMVYLSLLAGMAESKDRLADELEELGLPK